MPTYAYRCKSCSFELEEFQKFSDPPLTECPSCGENTLVRLIVGSGLVFKGSGFYLTDYKKKPASPSEEGKTKSPAPASDAKNGTSSSSTPAEKPATPKSEPPSST